MDLSVYLPLYLGLALVAVLPRMVRILPPRTGVWCLSAAALTASISWIVSLSLIALTGLGRITFVANEGHFSASVWRRMDPVGVWTARVAGVVLTVCLARLVHRLVLELLARRQIRRLSGGFNTDDVLVFVDDEAPHAYAVGGRHPRIVVSRGLIRGMDAAERRAVLSHESAHLRHRHDMHLMVLRLAAALNPLLRPFVPAGALAVERWADEETAVSVGDRVLVARALVRAALAGSERARTPPAALAHATGDVSFRVTALMQGPPRPRRSITAVASLLLIATFMAPGVTATNLGDLLDAAMPGNGGGHGPAQVTTPGRTAVPQHRP
jgi:hypothetical protein